MSVKLKSSSGLVADEATVDVVVRSLFTDPAAWTKTPDASIIYSLPDGSKATMLVAYASDRGYYVHLLDGNRKIWILIETPTSINPEAVEIDEDYSVSAGLLCDQAIAMKAVEWFVKNGEKDPDLNWISDRDLPPDVAF